MCGNVDTDECATNTAKCDTHASCSNTPAGSYTCTCNIGYNGNGFTCDGMLTAEAGLCVTLSIAWLNHESLFIFSLYTWPLSHTIIAQLPVENGSM